jgi:hypothetical protein
VEHEAEGGERPSAGVWRQVPLGLVAATAMITGYIGLWQYVHTPNGSQFGRAWWDVLYYDLQLFALGSKPLEGGTPFNPALEVGRFLAAATTAYALLLAASALFGDALRRWRRRRAKGHAIVVGTTPAARAIAERRERSMKVLRVPTTDPAALHAAGLSRARVVYACGADGEDAVANLAAALAAASPRRRRDGQGMRINVQVTDPTLALGLKARRLMRSGHQGPVIDFFSMDEMAARKYVESDPFDEPVRPRILVAGAGAFGQAVIVEFARQWRRRSPTSTERVAVTLVDDHAAEAADLLVDRWPVVREVCDITPVTGNGMPSGPSDAYYRAFFCQEDEQLALSSALSAVSLWRGGPRSVVVRLNQLARHEAAFDGADGLLDNLGGRISVVNVADAAGDLVVQDREPVGELAAAVHGRYMHEVAAANLARSIHESYRTAAEGRSHDAAGAGAGPAVIPWEKLDEEYRAANRAQAEDFTNKLRRIGCTIAPRSARMPAFDLRGDELEVLAVQEHDRWMAERAGRGWRHGPVRDDRKKLHPDLVPWDELTEASKEKDRDAVRNLPTVYDTALAEVGLQIVRLN